MHARRCAANYGIGEEKLGMVHNTEQAPPHLPDRERAPGEPPAQNLYLSLIQARKEKRGRWMRWLGALSLLLVALPVLWVLVTGGATYLNASSALHTISPVALGSTSLGAAPAITATSSLLSSGTLPSTATSPNPLPAPTWTISASAQLPLYGRRIGLDPGHGPRGDSGAVLTDPDTGKLILSEDDFNLDVALRTRDLLRARGAAVVLTREAADTFTAPWPADANGDGIVGASGDDLQERVDILNNFKAEVFLSIHANGGDPSVLERQDVQVVYCGDSDCNFPAQSKQLGHLVSDQLDSKLAGAGYTPDGAGLVTDLDTDSSVPPQHLFLLGPVNPPRHVRATSMPGVLAESLYVSSPEQAAELNKESIRQAIALAYADALQAFLTGSSGN